MKTRYRLYRLSGSSRASAFCEALRLKKWGTRFVLAVGYYHLAIFTLMFADYLLDGQIQFLMFILEKRFWVAS